MNDTPERTRSADRAEEVATSRRRRFVETATDSSLRRFGVPDSILDMNKYVYRAALDVGTRLIDLTQNDDYDFVTTKGDKASGQEAAGVVKYQSGTVDGRPQYTYLLRKPKQFADEHRAEAVAKIDANERLHLSQRHSEAPDQSYTPKR